MDTVEMSAKLLGILPNWLTFEIRAVAFDCPVR